MDAVLQARDRDVALGSSAAAPGAIREFHGNLQDEWLAAMGSSQNEEITRLGRQFQVRNVATFAAVVAVPSTACGLAVYNNEPDGGRSYVIDYVSAKNMVSTTLIAAQASMVALVGQVREAIPATSAALPKKTNGLGSVDSKARTIVQGTALPAGTGIAANWFPIGQSAVKYGLDITPGYSMEWEANGRVICPPGRYFAVHVIANTTSETFQCEIFWHEQQLTLG